MSRIKNGFDKGFDNQRLKSSCRVQIQHQLTSATHQQMIVAVGNSRDVILQGPSPLKTTDARSISFSLGPLLGCCVSLCLA